MASPKSDYFIVRRTQDGRPKKRISAPDCQDWRYCIRLMVKEEQSGNEVWLEIRHSHGHSSLLYYTGMTEDEIRYESQDAVNEWMQMARDCPDILEEEMADAE